MEVSLKILLESDILKGAQIIAGESGSDKKVKSINILDTPDGYKYMQEGAFCIATTYSWSGDQEQQKLLMERLMERGITAIGILLRHYNGSFPENIKFLADKVGIPICSIRNDIAYADLIEFFNKNIYVDAIDKFLTLDNIREIFLDCYKGEFLSCIANKLNYLLGKEVYIKFGEKSFHFGGETSVKGIMENIEKRQCEVIHNKEISNTQKAYYCALTTEGEEYFWSSFEFSHNETADNMIWIMGQQKDFMENDFYIINRALKVIDSELKRQSFVQDKVQEDFIRKLIKNEFKNYEEAVAKAQKINYQLPEKVSVLLIEGWIKREEFHRIRSNISKIFGIEEYENSFLLGNYDNNFIIIFPEIEKNPVTKDDFAEEILRDSLLNKYLYAGQGTLRDFNEVNRSLSEAKEALFWAKLQDAKRVISFEELGVIQLLSKIDTVEKVRKYVNNYLFKVKEYDSLNNSELLKTLTSLVDNDWNRLIAAQTLFVHQNTVKYRQQILEKMLNVKKNRLNIEIAVKLNNFFRIL